MLSCDKMNQRLLAYNHTNKCYGDNYFTIFILRNMSLRGQPNIISLQPGWSEPYNQTNGSCMRRARAEETWFLYVS
jgi:hypothetical protein